MSNLPQIENLKQIVVKTQTDFETLAKIHGAVNYKREAAFAIQALEANNYLQTQAMKNPDSLKNAVINVAAIGLSLSPVHKLAYLVPRNNQVCLDISYMGLIKLATDCGAIKFCKAELVFSKDKFKVVGLGKEPKHEFTPFEDRGDFKGVYCVAKTHDNDFIVEFMTAKEIDSIKARSEAAKKNYGPWISDFSEMAKKSVIKRAYKAWPKTDSRQRFEEAIDVTNQADPIDLISSPLPELGNESNEKRLEQIAKISESLKFLNRELPAYIKHLNTTLNREIKELENLTDIELEQSLISLDDMVEKKRVKDLNINNEEIEKQKQALIDKLKDKNEDPK